MRTGERAAGDDALWQPPPPQPGMIPWGGPRDLAGERRWLRLELRVWSSVLRKQVAPATARSEMKSLVADARDAGWLRRGCTVEPHLYVIADEAASLEPALLIEGMTGVLPQPVAAKLAFESAYRRYSNGHLDAFTGELATYAIENGSLK